MFERSSSNELKINHDKERLSKQINNLNEKIINTTSVMKKVLITIYTNKDTCLLARKAIW